MPQEIQKGPQEKPEQKEAPKKAPEDAANDEKKKEVKDKYEDEKFLEKEKEKIDDRKITQLSDAAKKKVVDLVLARIQAGDKKMESITHRGKLEDEMEKKGMLNFVDSLKKNGIDAIQFDVYGSHDPNVPLRVKNEHGSTPIYLSVAELGLSKQELTAMQIVELQKRIQAEEADMKHIQEMPDDEFKRDFNPEKYKTTREDVIKERKRWIDEYNSEIQDLKNQLQ